MVLGRNARQAAWALTGGVFAICVAAGAGADETSTGDEAPDYAAEAQRVIETFDATGMTAIAMVEGEIVYHQSFGVADKRTQDPITDDTLFPIGSMSKAFTAAALAILVDRDVIEWDAPITTTLPEFSMHDPWVTEHFSVRDALTHRSGLPLGAGDLLFWPDGEGDASDVINALPHLQPVLGFRTEFAYDNIMYIVAGEVVARASGKSWADFVTDEIFKPLGLKTCAATRSRINDGAHVVTGHQFATGADESAPVDQRTVLREWVAPAGGISCTAKDMMTWAQFWFDGGVTSDGERVISEKQMTELWRGVTPLPAGAPMKQRGSTIHGLYALGWSVQDFQGAPMATHAGGVAGVISNFVLLPQHEIAIFAAINDERQGAVAWTYQLADGFIGEQDIDYIKVFGDRLARTSDQAQSALADAFEPPENAAAPSAPLPAYAGVYNDPWYGPVTITAGPDGLSIDMSRSELLDGPLTHVDGDTFVAAWPNRSLNADAFVTFAVEGGAATGFTMKAVSDATDFSYDFHDLNLVRVETVE